jgi:pilus assembly protein CpaF
MFFYIKSKNEKSELEVEDKVTFDTLLDDVKYGIAEIVREESEFGLSTSDWNKWYNRKSRIEAAMRDSVYGVSKAKSTVKELIRSIISEKLHTKEDILSIVDFESKYMDPRVKFEILLYFYKRRHKKEALGVIIDKYNLARERYNYDEDLPDPYYVEDSDIESIYQKEMFELGYDEMLDMLTVLLYQKYRGFGIIDTILEMDISGLTCGTSGSIMSSILNKDQDCLQATQSVWVHYHGKYIHFRFLDFYSQEELRRVVQLIGKHGNPGPLTERRGYLVTTMWDKSRVLAVRPSVGEYWGVFVRKFTLPNVSLAYLLDPEEERVGHKVINAFLVIELLKFLMICRVTTAFTGRQGCGKTTLMTGVAKYIDSRFNIRLLEMTPEQFLRELYPDKNIYSVSETEWVSATALQDALKKSDGAISIVGEVATDHVAARLIQMAQIASLFTMFSHHANTTDALVSGIRNSLFVAAGFSSHLVAEQQTVSVLKVDVHLDMTAEGEKYVDRVTEIIALPEGVPYPEYDIKDPVHSMNRITKEYFERQTDRRTYATRDIIKYNVATHTYEVVNWFSSELTDYMLKNLPIDKANVLKTFARTHWSNYFRKAS